MSYLKKEEKEILIKCKKVIDAVRVFGPADKNTIVNNTKLAWNTVSAHLEELFKIRIVDTKNDSTYYLRNDFGFFVGISLGVTEIKISIVGMNFEYDKTTKAMILSLYEFLNDAFLNSETSSGKDYSVKLGVNEDYLCIPAPEDFNDAYSICSFIIQGILNSNNKRIFSIGMCVPGIINKTTHVVDFSPNIQWLANRNAYDLIRKSLLKEMNDNGISFRVFHDMDCVSVYEVEDAYKHNKAPKNKDIICLYMSYGIGSTLIKNNGLRLFSSSEHGHIITDIDSFERTKELKIKDPSFSICACGQDCLENQIRRKVFNATDIKSFQRATEKKSLLELPDDKAKLFSKYIGFLINHIINTMRVNYIIISGKSFLLTKSISLDIDKIRVSYSIPALSNNCAIILGNADLDIPAIGASMIAYHCFFSKEAPEDLIVSW